jgi:Family of unknown function (DUF6459)
LTASRIRFPTGALTAPVVDYEPPPFDAAVPCPTPTPAALHRPPRQQLRAVQRTAAVALPAEAGKFTEAALRRVLEVIDRRRPIAQLRAMLTPPVLDMVFTLTRTAGPDKAAVLQRVRLRTAAVDERDPQQASAAEVFATYTRGERVRAIAGRIEATQGRWHVVALQIG